MREKIIGRLLTAGHITAEEAVALLTGEEIQSKAVTDRKLSELNKAAQDELSSFEKKLQEIQEELKRQKDFNDIFKPIKTNPWEQPIDTPWPSPLKPYEYPYNPYDQIKTPIFPWDPNRVQVTMQSTPETTSADGPQTAGYTYIYTPGAHPYTLTEEDK